MRLEYNSPAPAPYNIVFVENAKTHDIPCMGETINSRTLFGGGSYKVLNVIRFVEIGKETHILVELKLATEL